MAVSFEVGDTLSSYKDLKNRVEEYEKINFVQLAHGIPGHWQLQLRRRPRSILCLLDPFLSRHHTKERKGSGYARLDNFLYA